MPQQAQSESWTGVNASLPEGTPVPPTPEALGRRNRLAHAKRVRQGGTVRRPRSGDGWSLTTADEALLAGATRYGVMTWRQAANRFYDGVRRTGVRRIGYLREAGLVRQSRNDEWAGRVLWPSAAGTSLVREQLPVPISAPQQHPGERLLHRLAVTDVGLRFEGRRQRVLTEREIRTAESTRGLAAQVAAGLDVDGLRSVTDGRHQQRWLCVPVGASGQVHYPDLIVVTAGGLVAVEVEVTVKPMHRLREILRGYRAAADLFTQVVYLTTGPVAALLHGWREQAGEQAGEWSPGVLQQLSLLPDGPPDYRDDSPVRVQQLHPHDPGVAYRLDLRQMPDSWWVPKSEWDTLRAEWEADTTAGKSAKVPFLRWWRDIHPARDQLTTAS